MKRLSDVKAFLFDMDGTLVLGDQVIDGANELLRYLEKEDLYYAIVTNNSSNSAAFYADKLTRLGLEVPHERIITSAHATIDWLKHHAPVAKLYVVGTAALEEELRRAGFVLVPPDANEADIVVMGFDTTLTYEKLVAATRFVLRGARLIATNPDLRCPVVEGFIPDCGSITRVIELTTGVKATYLGKPEPEIVKAALRGRNINLEDVAFVGDRLYTDVATARKNGLVSVLVLTGETSADQLPEQTLQPDFVFHSVRQLYDALRIARGR